MDLHESFTRFFEDTPLPISESERGNGHFGHWTTDPEGNPAYLYEPEPGRKGDHWHLVGNDRVIATAHSGGYVQFYDWTRGCKLINRWDPLRKEYAGGFKIIEWDGEVFPTLPAYLPHSAKQQRLFGMGYFEKTTEYKNLHIIEKISAPQGDDSVLLSITTLKNNSSEPLTVSVTEYWTANLLQITGGPIITHNLDRLWNWQREQWNRRFTVTTEWNKNSATLSASFSHVKKNSKLSPQKPTFYDHFPKPVFLASLDPLPSGYSEYITNGTRFWDNSDIQHLPNTTDAADGSLISQKKAYRSGILLAMRRTVTLKPGEEISLQYLYGCDETSRIPDLVVRYKRSHEAAPHPALEFSAPEAPWLSRELKWHSYYLQAGSIYQDFYQAHVVDQGSAYSYGHGAAGAPRDFVLATLPLIYLRPDLAKDSLRFIMRSQNAKTGEIPYAFIDYGQATGILVHSKCSDLDIFFLWGLGEYLGMTRDYDFLNESLSYYPPAKKRSGTVLDHARTAFKHLTEKIGLGPHGVIRCLTGDWNDVLFAFSKFSLFTLFRGESSLNAGLVTLALPPLAAVLEPVDAELSNAMRQFSEAQAKALQQFWTGQWVARGYTGRGDKMLGTDHLFLDTQSFGVLGGVWNEEQRNRLFENIRALCAEPQKAGARCLWPPRTGAALEPGSDTNGGTWAAIDSWTSWAWSTHDSRAGWDFYLTTTLATRAETYPDTWYGIWSGPDSFNAHYHSRPGETFDVNVTAMVKFPVMNMNRHCGPLTDAIKLAGIGTRNNQIVIMPLLPFDTFTLRLPLIGIAYHEKEYRGYYRPVASGDFSFAIRPPANLSSIRLSVNGAGHPFTNTSDGLICFEVHGEPGQTITWEMNEQ